MLHTYDSIHVLLVEDDEDQANLTRIHLQHDKIQYKVKHVRNADECLRAVRRDKFDIVLLDYNLPNASGIEIFKQIKPAIGDIPVVFASLVGAAVENIIERCPVDILITFHQGFNRYGPEIIRTDG